MLLFEIQVKKKQTCINLTSTAVLEHKASSKKKKKNEIKHTKSGPEVLKLSSAETKIYPAHNC